VKTVLLSAAVSLFFALFGTPLAIKVFTRRGYGQEIRSDGPAGHLSKRGTPTMGGTVIITASLAGYLIGHIVTGDPFGRLDHRFDLFSPVVVRNAEDGGVAHLGMGQQHILDLGRVDVGPARNDHVDLAVPQEEVPVLVQVAHVAHR